MALSENEILIINRDEKFEAVDLFRIISAVIVIAIHTNPFSSIASGMTGRIIRMVFEFPVPFFFITSGFFLQKKLSVCTDYKEIKNCLIKNAKHLIITYIFWELVYLPFALYGIKSSGDASFISKVYSYFHSLVFIGKFYYSHHLWYVVAAIWAVVLLWLFTIFNINKKKQWMISLVLFLSGVFFSTDNVISNFFVLSICASVYRKIFGLGGVVYGLLYYQMGMFVYRHFKLENNKIKWKFLVLLFLIGSSGIWFGAEFKNIFVPLYVMPLFCLIINVPEMQWKGYFYLRKISGYMYFSHLLFMWLGVKIVNILYKGMKPEIPLFIFTVIISFLFGVICFKLKNNNMHLRD